MNDWKNEACHLVTSEDGATSIEYALLGSLIAAVCVLTIVSVGTNLDSLYVRVCNEVTTAISGAPAC